MCAQALLRWLAEEFYAAGAVASVLAVVAAVLVFRVKWSLLRTLGVCAVPGLAAGLAVLPVA